MYIDSHCHLNHSQNSDVTPYDLISQAKSNHVMGLQTICCRISQEYQQLISISEEHENVWCSVGTHPHDASDPAEKKYTVDDIVELSKHPKVIGIGESGLDYFYDYADREDQKLSFRKHIQACMITGLPLIVHARDADEDCIQIIKEEMKNNPSKTLNGVLHCFSSGEKMALQALHFGFYISFSGMITFKNMQWLRDIALKIPQDKVLIETDAPFLAPMPYRGKTNQPAYVAYTALELAKLYNLTQNEAGILTKNNFFNLFTKARKTWVEPQK